MKTLRARWASPAVAISLIALVVALGGTSYAAFSLPKNSVGTKQLKDGAVSGPKIKNGAVGKNKLNVAGLVVPSALRATSANTARTATAAANATHAANADNATNASSATHAASADNATNAATAATATAVGSVTYVQNTCTVSAGTTRGCMVQCPSGTSPIGGGGTNTDATVAISRSVPVNFANGSTPSAGRPADGWNVTSSNTTGLAESESVWAICVAVTSVSPR